MIVHSEVLFQIDIGLTKETVILWVNSRKNYKERNFSNSLSLDSRKITNFCIELTPHPDRD
jgi:hypothetical protein